MGGPSPRTLFWRLCIGLTERSLSPTCRRNSTACSRRVISATVFTRTTCCHSNERFGGQRARAESSHQGRTRVFSKGDTMKSQRFAERDPREDERGGRHAPKTESVARAFLELFQLLEEYAPSWYTEEIRHHAESAARIPRSTAWRRAA